LEGADGPISASQQKISSEAGQPARLKVNGTINNYRIENFGLMPMGEGEFMLPLKVAIRKAIRKTEGDQVQVILYIDTTPLKVPEELLLCLRDEPEAATFFTPILKANANIISNGFMPPKRRKQK
jgi:hypothetical protein